MKYVLKKFASIGVAFALSFSVVSCDSGEEKSKSGRSDSPEAAMQNFLQGIIDADADDVCKAMAPKELWDYVCKDTGLSKEKILQRLLEGDTLEDYSKYCNEIDVKASDIIIEDKHDESDDAYNAFGQAMSNADIDESIDHIYYVETGPDREPFYDMDGFAYEIDDNWYFGSEWVLENFIEVAIDGYSALPEEEHYEDDDNEDYLLRNNVNLEYNENIQHDSQTKSESVNLCADPSHWNNWSSEENGCAATLKVLSDGADLEIVKTHGSNGEHTYFYYNQLKYENIVLEKGATYRLEFNLEAADYISFEYTVEPNYEPYTPYVDEIVTASNGLTHYMAKFTMQESCDDAAVAFNLNYPDAAVPYTVSVHNLTLTRIS